MIATAAARPHRDDDAAHVTIYGHRGASGYRPERVDRVFTDNADIAKAVRDDE